MRKIAVMNQKGGVGKTTTAINLAAGLAIKGKNVLLLDLDPQGHVANFFPDETYKKNMFELLTNGATYDECIIRAGENLSVIKSSKEMRGAELILFQKKDNAANKLGEKLESLKGFDYVIADCPPSVGIVTQNAMNYCDEAFIPVSADPLGIDGLKKILFTLQEFNAHAIEPIRISRIIPTLYDKRNKICKDSLNELQNEFYELTTEPIHINSKLKEAPLHHKSIFTYAKNSRGAKDYAMLVDNVLHEEIRVSAAEKTASKHGAVAAEE